MEENIRRTMKICTKKLIFITNRSIKEATPRAKLKTPLQEHYCLSISSFLNTAVQVNYEKEKSTPIYQKTQAASLYSVSGVP